MHVLQLFTRTFVEDDFERYPFAYTHTPLGSLLFLQSYRFSSTTIHSTTYENTYSKWETESKRKTEKRRQMRTGCCIEIAMCCCARVSEQVNTHTHTHTAQTKIHVPYCTVLVHVCTCIKECLSDCTVCVCETTKAGKRTKAKNRIAHRVEAGYSVYIRLHFLKLTFILSLTRSLPEKTAYVRCVCASVCVCCTKNDVWLAVWLKERSKRRTVISTEPTLSKAKQLKRFSLQLIQHTYTTLTVQLVLRILQIGHNVQRTANTTSRITSLSLSLSLTNTQHTPKNNAKTQNELKRLSLFLW